MHVITSEQIELLQFQNCWAEDWNTIFVADDFKTEYVRNCQFFGNVNLGNFDLFIDSCGMHVHSGVFNSVLVNSSVADNSYVNNVSHMDSCMVETAAVVSCVGSISCPQNCSFGNGVEVATYNEAGGRPVKMFDGLTAQMAFIRANMAYIDGVAQAIDSLADSVAESYSSCKCFIGSGAVVRNCGSLDGVYICEGAVIDGCLSLSNGTVKTQEESETLVGNGVIARDFLIMDGAKVTDGAILDRCFVGQGCLVGKQFSATDVLFFANCQAFHGEADSLFAGPYTVSHHKGSLLIAGLFSFMNVGSSSNQSNHAYKLGPIHQGWMQRGCKFASGSHVIWPAQIGAFSMVMGHVACHPDTLDFPFSYIIDNGSDTWLVPGIALMTAGLVRDAQKWPKRDLRAASGRLDIVNSALFSPYTIQSVLRGIERLEELENACDDKEFVMVDGLKIKQSAIQRGLMLYYMAVDKYVGDFVVGRLSDGGGFDTFDDISEADACPWIDVAGLIAPSGAVSNIFDDLAAGKYNSVDDLSLAFSQLQWNYEEFEERWIYAKFGPFSDAYVQNILSKWIDAACKFDDFLLADANKDYSDRCMISYGVEMPGSAEDDFIQVHGSYDSNSFVNMVRQHKQKNQELAQKFIV